MQVMSTPVRVALVASLDNATHGWVMRAVNEHIHTEPAPPAGEGESPGSPIVVTIHTYQLVSDPLGLALVATIEGTTVEINYGGTSFRTEHAGLRAQLQAWAVSSLAWIEADLIRRLGA